MNKFIEIVYFVIVSECVFVIFNGFLLFCLVELDILNIVMVCNKYSEIIIFVFWLFGEGMISCYFVGGCLYCDMGFNVFV